MSEELFRLACVVLWKLWNFWNGIVHDSEVSELEKLVERSRDILNSYLLVRFVFPVGNPVPATVPWLPPLIPHVKLILTQPCLIVITFRLLLWLAIPLEVVWVGR